MALLLVSDSDATARDSVARALRLRGHRVRCASTGPAAAAIRRQRPPPDLIVLGISAADPGAVRAYWEPLCREAGGVPVVACAASKRSLGRLGDLELVAWFTKPIDVGRLLDFVDGYVSGDRFRASPPLDD